MKKRHQVLFYLFMLTIITYFDRVCVSVAGVRIKADLGLTNDQFGWVLGVFALSYGAFEIPAGALGDRIGPRSVLMRIVIWWSAFTALTGAAYNYVSLLVVRFLFGAGEAGAFPNSAIVVARWFPVLERGRAQSFIWLGSRVGSALAPLIIVPIQMYYGWKASFYLFGFIGVLWAIAWYIWFRDEPADMPGIKPEELHEIESKRSVKGSNHSVLPWRVLFGNTNLWVLMLAYHFYMYGAFFFYTWMPTFLQEGRGFNEEDMGVFATLPFVLGAVGCLTGGFLSDFLVTRVGLKWARRSIAIAGLLLSGISMMGAAYSDDKIITVVFLSLGLAFKDLTLPVAWAVSLDIGGKNSGVVSATMNMSGQVGSFLVAILFGYVQTATGSYNVPMYIIGILMVLSGLLWLKIDATKPVSQEEVLAL